MGVKGLVVSKLLQFFFNARFQRIQTKPMLTHFILSLLRDVRPVIDFVGVDIERILLQHANDDLSQC